MLRSRVFRCVLMLWCAASVVVLHGELSAAGNAVQPFRVVILGSSTAAGEAARPLDSSWVNKYTRYLGTILATYDVVNLAVGGYTTFNIMPNGYAPPSPWNIAKYQPSTGHNITYALQLAPSLIIINMPTNDCADYVPVYQQVANYNRIIQDADAAGVPVWISTTQPRNLDLTGRTLLQQMRDATFSNYPSRTIDFWTGLADVNGSILPLYNYDGTHLNNAGHEVLYQRVVNTVQLRLPLHATPGAIDFGNQRVGATVSQMITLENTTPSSISVDAITAGSAAFSADHNSAVIAAGGRLNVNVFFTPNAVRTFHDTLLVHNNSADPNLKIPLVGVSPSGTLQASRSAIDFGQVALQTTKEISVTLSTSSLNDAAITSASFDHAGFSVRPATGIVTPSSSMNMIVGFTPDRFGSFDDTLRIQGVFANSALLIPVKGLSPTPVLSTTPTSLDFGDVQLNSTQYLTLTLGNTSLNTLSIDAVVTTNPHFYASPSTGTVPSSGTFDVVVQFSPTEFGEVRDTIQIITGASGVPVRVPIRGNSPLPTISLSRTQVVFPQIGRGDAVTRSVTLYNEGSSPIAVSSFNTQTRHYTVTNATPLTVNALDSLVFTIRFGPDTTGDLRDTIAVNTNAGQKRVAVVGTSPVSVLVTSVPSVSFGSVKFGTQLLRPLVLRVNTPDNQLTVKIDSVRLYRAGFLVSGMTNPVTLTRQDSLVLAVGFYPSQLVTYRDTLHIYNNTILPVIRVPLSGVGGTFTDVAPVIAEVPGQVMLLQNYPNPFNPSTVIGFELSASCAVTLAVYDLVGREIARLVAGAVSAGHHERVWDASAVSAGVYFYRLVATPQGAATAYTETRKLLLVK